VDYAYQLLKLNEDRPIMRWDNKEEFRDLNTYPNHFHDDQGNFPADQASTVPAWPD
jgi:hypothetical protein